VTVIIHSRWSDGIYGATIHEHLVVMYGGGVACQSIHAIAAGGHATHANCVRPKQQNVTGC